MPKSRFELEEAIRQAAAELPEFDRVMLLTNMLAELRGPDGLELLSLAAGAIQTRVHALIRDVVAETGGV